MILENNFGLLFVLLSCVWTHTNAQFRIIGGHYIPIESSPHSVALLNKRGYFCGGSIVKLKSVLTAAHCVKPEIMENIIVVAGVADIRQMYSREAQRRNVEDILYDCEYNPETKFMDIAVVKVDTPFDLNGAVNIIPLCNVPLEPDSLMEISGWGITDVNIRTGSPLLKTTTVKIADTQQSRDAYANKEGPQYFAETIMYAGRSSEDMGLGDSGAAGVRNGQLCAVAQGFCWDPDFPGLYTNVTNQRVFDFIIDKM